MFAVVRLDGDLVALVTSTPVLAPAAVPHVLYGVFPLDHDADGMPVDGSHYCAIIEVPHATMSELLFEQYEGYRPYSCQHVTHCFLVGVDDGTH